jgi:dimeric dUTPase (all-alpha-NTP-PPase superfamily)
MHSAPVPNNVRYASNSDHSRYESELTLWAISGLMQCSKKTAIRTLFDHIVGALLELARNVDA